MRGGWREGKDMILTMVLIEDMLMLLMLIEDPSVLPSKCNRNTASAATNSPNRTRSDNGNSNRDTQTTTQQSRNAREGKDTLLAIVLIENVLTLLVMLLICPPVTC